MKKLAVLFFGFAMSATVTFANNDVDKKKKEENSLRTEIVKLLGDYRVEETTSAEVSFMINRKGEIVVLSVKSQNEDVENYVKAALNYQSVENAVAKRMKVYKLPLKMVKA
jgi:septal ring factor EnvC (AmiA/AmiB activator)